MRGVVDSHTAPALAARIEALGTTGDVVLDIAGVDFIDSSGLRVVVAAHGSLDDAGQKLILVGASDSVDRLLQITALDGHLHRR